MKAATAWKRKNIPGDETFAGENFLPHLLKIAGIDNGKGLTGLMTGIGVKAAA
jgi:hypothetical protein